MKMNYVDREGRETGPSHWVDLPVATRHSNGFSEVEGDIARVLASRAASSWAQFSTMSGKTSISVGKHEGKLQLSLVVDQRRLRHREAAVRNFFAHHQIRPTQDYLAGNGGIAKSTRVLVFPLPNDAGVAAEIATDLLQEIYQLKSTTTLDIRFEEHEAS